MMMKAAEWLKGLEEKQAAVSAVEKEVCVGKGPEASETRLKPGSAMRGS